jgi:TetR/AcrR family transcriptional regulator, transcriptional repressor for nem operon
LTWPAAALSAEIPRHSRNVRSAFERGREEYAARLSRFLPGGTEAERRKNFYLLFSGMAGALMVARTIGDEEARLRSLNAAKKFYTEAFCPA